MSIDRYFSPGVPCVSSDNFGGGQLAAEKLLELGLRVPEDVQLIGFDGIRRFAEEGFVCSTIVQPIERIAETGVELLLREDRSSLPSQVCLPVSYAPGGTTKE